MSTILDFPADCDPDIVLRAVHRAGIKDFILIGCDRDGHERIVTDLTDGGDILWHLRRTEHKLMEGADGLVRPHDGPPAGA